MDKRVDVCFVNSDVAQIGATMAVFVRNQGQRSFDVMAFGVEQAFVLLGRELGGSMSTERRQ